jgi:nucleoside-triphosphatase THEP1
MRPCTIITGPIHSGKTTLLRKMIENYRSLGFSVGGIITEALYNGGGRKTGFDAVDIATGRKIPLVREGEFPSGPGVQRIGRFALSGTGLEAASKILLTAAGLSGRKGGEVAGVDILCLDEVGPLEVRGQGYFPVLQRILKSYEGRLVVIGRSEVYEGLADYLRSEGWEPEVLRPENLP